VLEILRGTHRVGHSVRDRYRRGFDACRGSGLSGAYRARLSCSGSSWLVAGPSRCVADHIRPQWFAAAWLLASRGDLQLAMLALVLRDSLDVRDATATSGHGWFILIG